MAHQPDDGKSKKEIHLKSFLHFFVLLASQGIFKYDDEEYNALDGQLKLFSYCQGDNSTLLSPVDDDSSSPPVDQSILAGSIDNFGDPFNQSQNGILEDLFPEAILSDSSLVDGSEGTLFRHFPTDHLHLNSSSNR